MDLNQVFATPPPRFGSLRSPTADGKLVHPCIQVQSSRIVASGVTTAHLKRGEVHQEALIAFHHEVLLYLIGRLQRQRHQQRSRQPPCQPL